MDKFKQRVIDWYNRNIIAGWYRSLSLIAGWLTAAALFVPDLLQFVTNYWGILADLALPQFSAESKSLILGLFVAFVAPPLRAWSQKKMREAALRQAEARGDAIVIPEASRSDPS